MKIYIDNDFKCHASSDGTLREIETDFFEGKCRRFIEGYCFVPSGEKWTRSDGVTFIGEMISPRIDYNILTAYQEQYEETLEYITAVESINSDQAAALNAIYTGAVST